MIVKFHIKSEACATFCSNIKPEKRDFLFPMNFTSMILQKNSKPSKKNYLGLFYAPFLIKIRLNLPIILIRLKLQKTTRRQGQNFVTHPVRRDPSRLEPNINLSIKFEQRHLPKLTFTCSDLSINHYELILYSYFSLEET